MSESLRRSTRRVKKRPCYSVGDIVELDRNNSIVLGRIVISLSQNPPKWLVTFDQGDLPDEELHEDFLGPVVDHTDKDKKVEQAEPASPVAATEESQNLKTDDNSNSKKKSSRSSASGGSSSDDHSTSKGNDDPTDLTTAAARAKRLSDREQRSRRRQAIIEDVAHGTPGVPFAASAKPSLNKRPSSNGGNSKSKKPRTGSSNGGQGSQNPNFPNPKDGEQVTKVQMLTGTLYLYRGIRRRRVAFVRKY